MWPESLSRASTLWALRERVLTGFPPRGMPRTSCAMLVMASVVLASAGTSAEWVPADSARLNFKFGNDLSWEATKLSKQQALARKAVLNQTANALAHVWNYRGIVDAGAFDSTSEHAAPWGSGYKSR